jgi:uncharacterized protein YecE (DUF72 family)
VTENEHRVLIGTSSWQKGGWRKSFYPPGLAHAKELAYLADRIGTIEINSTWHGLQKASSFRAWRDDVSERFVFSVKAWQGVTHAGPLRNAAGAIATFLASGPLLLGAKLGSFLWQFPSSFGFDAEVMGWFFASLPRSIDEARAFIVRNGGRVDGELAEIPDGPLRHAVEVRNASFAQPRYRDLLRRHGISDVVTDVERAAAVDDLTADFVYVRFDVGVKRFPAGQSEAELARHAERIRRWAGRADVYFYFDDPDYRTHPSDRPPFEAVALQRLVGGQGPEPGATLQPSLW